MLPNELRGKASGVTPAEAGYNRSPVTETCLNRALAPRT